MTQDIFTYDVFLQDFKDKVKDTLDQKGLRIAEYLSICPDPSKLLLKFPKGPRRLYDFLADLYITSILAGGSENKIIFFNTWEGIFISCTEEARLSKILKEISLLKDSGRQGFDLLLMKYFSRDDLKGNFLPRVARRLRHTELISLDEIEKARNRKKIKRAMRKRGYTDKGIQRPRHRWLPRNAFAESERPKEGVKVEWPREFYGPSNFVDVELTFRFKEYTDSLEAIQKRKKTVRRKIQKIRQVIRQDLYDLWLNKCEPSDAAFWGFEAWLSASLSELKDPEGVLCCLPNGLPEESIFDLSVLMFSSVTRRMDSEAALERLRALRCTLKP